MSCRDQTEPWARTKPVYKSGVRRVRNTPATSPWSWQRSVSLPGCCCCWRGIPEGSSTVGAYYQSRRAETLNMNTGPGTLYLLKYLADKSKVLQNYFQDPGYTGTQRENKPPKGGISVNGTELKAMLHPNLA